MLKAVIFDLDGVVADSHPIHEVAWKSLHVEAGLNPDSINVEFLYAGHPRREILRHYLGPLSDSEIQHWGRRKDELYELAAKNLQPKPGIPEALSQLLDAGIPCALATSAGRKRTLESLQVLGVKEYFSIVITGEDIHSPKPAPDIFLLAAQELNVRPQDAVVVEDSVAGVQAAIAAGMKCVGYTSAERAAELRQAGADVVLAELPKDAVEYFRLVVSSRDLSTPASTKQISRQER